MSVTIKLTPQELQAQATEMKALEADYQSLFSNISGTLQNTNTSWSPNLSNNFSGKITSVQKSFMQITQELMNGAKAADACAVTFESIDSQLAKLYCTGEESDSSPEQSKISIENAKPMDGVRYEDLPSWLQEWAKKANKKIYGDKSSVLQVIDAIQEGDYATALEKCGKSIIKAYAKANKVNELLVNYILNATENGVEAYVEYAQDPSLLNFCNIGWGTTVGAVLETAGDKAWDTVKFIPVISDWYEKHDVDSMSDAFNTMYTEWTRRIFGENVADSVCNYYADNGGLFKGLVNGFESIKSEIDKSCEKYGGIIGAWKSGWNSIFD